jgi:hypothetical protein
MQPISDALELLTAQHEQIEDLFEQVRQIGDEAALVELADKLSNHLALEREVFYPAIAAHLSAPVLDELCAEHTAIKQALADLSFMPIRGASFRGKLTELGNLLFGHSAWQEDELFTAIAESVAKEELATLCDRFYHFDAPAIAA